MAGADLALICAVAFIGGFIGTYIAAWLAKRTFGDR